MICCVPPELYHAIAAFVIDALNLTVRRVMLLAEIRVFYIESVVGTAQYPPAVILKAVETVGAVQQYQVSVFIPEFCRSPVLENYPFIHIQLEARGNAECVRALVFHDVVKAQREREAAVYIPKGYERQSVNIIAGRESDIYLSHVILFYNAHFFLRLLYHSPVRSLSKSGKVNHVNLPLSSVFIFRRRPRNYSSAPKKAKAGA